MREVEEMYDSMGFDFYEEYDVVNKTVKPLVVDVDVQRQLLTERW